MANPALCPVRFSSEVPTRENRRHWRSSVCLSFLDPWSRVVQLHLSARLILSPVHDWFFRQPQPVGLIQPSRLSTGLQCFSGMLRCELTVAPDQFSDTAIQDNLHWDPIVRSLLCEGRSSLLWFPSARLPEERGTISAGLSIPTWISKALRLAFRVFCPRPISPTQGFISRSPSVSWSPVLDLRSWFTSVWSCPLFLPPRFTPVNALRHACANRAVQIGATLSTRRWRASPFEQIFLSLHGTSGKTLGISTWSHWLYEAVVVTLSCCLGVYTLLRYHVVNRDTSYSCRAVWATHGLSSVEGHGVTVGVLPGRTRVVTSRVMWSQSANSCVQQRGCA